MKINQINKIIDGIKNSIYYKQALTHISYCNEHNLSPSLSYENLEFLGDSILNFQTCHYIYKNFPEFDEGKMSKLKQLMVQEKTLSFISKEINLSKDIRLGTGEKKNKGGEKESILADIFESFLAALYLVRGQRQTANFLNLTLFTWVKGKEGTVWDYKTQLQEYCQANKNSVVYRLLESKKKDSHFFFTVLAEDKLKTFQEQGEGKSRKAAEQDAASKVLGKIGLVFV